MTQKPHRSLSMRLAGPVGEADEVHLAPPSAPLRGLNRGHEVEEGDDGEDAAAGQLGHLDSFMLFGELPTIWDHGARPPRTQGAAGTTGLGVKRKTIFVRIDSVADFTTAVTWKRQQRQSAPWRSSSALKRGCPRWRCVKMARLRCTRSLATS